MAKLPFETIIREAPIQGGVEWENITRDIINSYGTTQEKAGIELSKKINNLIQGDFDKVQDWYLNLSNLEKKEIRDGMAALDSRNAEKAKKLLDQINPKLRRGLELDHNDITYVNSRLALTINILMGGIQAAEKASNDSEYASEMDSRSYSALSRQEGVKMGGIPRFGQGKSSVAAENMKNAAEAMRKILAVSERLEIYFNQNKVAPDSIEEIIKELETGGKIELKKEKYVNAMDGQVSAIFRLETPEFNTQIKGGQKKGSTMGQAQMGLMRSAVESITDANKFLADDILKNFKKIWFSSMEVEGSPRIDKELMDQLTANFLQRKRKAVRTKSSKVQKTKPKIKTRTDLQRKKALADAKAKKAETSLKAIVARAAIGSRTKRGDSKGQRGLNTLRVAINKLLPAKVKQNMGRPALENRSGTFAESVRLETLTQGPRTVVGQYSYQYAPYETFENSDRWPSGYNPKPLITKSIRELAGAQVAAKFTLRKL